MRKGKKGFTLIEVAVFLAITGALFVGVTAGVQNSIYQQRKNDSVQNFMEFLRGAYSKVSNVQSTEGGKSNYAIYGKMITFGEKKNLLGADNTENSVFMYTIIGGIKESGTGNTLNLLAELGANVLKTDGTNTKYAGMVESYTPKWGARVEPPCSSVCKYEPLRGTVLIVRHPMSGNVYTYYSSSVVEVNETLKNGGTNPFVYDSGNKNYLTDGHSFKQEEINFCVNASGDGSADESRFDVRIVSGAHNASGIELISEDVGKCRKH